MSRTMPRQKPGRSEQAVGTPNDLLRAVKRRLGITEFDVDLAANKINKVARWHFGPQSPLEDNSLASWVRWKRGHGWSWLNPPFADIYPWMRKAKREADRYGARIAVLVPLSIAAWWVDFVHDQAVVLLLEGRITFKGHDKPYPKDCAIILFGSHLRPGYYVWKWKGKAE